jgi:hypothetical protein
LGFGEIQAIDLTHWKRNPRDPFFQDLCAAVKAKLEGRAVPPAKGHETVGAAADLEQFNKRDKPGGLALAFSLFSAQGEHAAHPFQPISDVRRPAENRATKAERVAWGRARQLWYPAYTSSIFRRGLITTRQWTCSRAPAKTDLDAKHAPAQPGHSGDNRSRLRPPQEEA